MTCFLLSNTVKYIRLVHCRTELYLQEVWVSLTCLHLNVALFLEFYSIAGSVPESIALDAYSEQNNVQGINVSFQDL